MEFFPEGRKKARFDCLDEIECAKSTKNLIKYINHRPEVRVRPIHQGVLYLIRGNPGSPGFNQDQFIGGNAPSGETGKKAGLVYHWITPPRGHGVN